jgi:hypothetical protein
MDRLSFHRKGQKGVRILVIQTPRTHDDTWRCVSWSNPDIQIDAEMCDAEAEGHPWTLFFDAKVAATSDQKEIHRAANKSRKSSRPRCR